MATKNDHAWQKYITAKGITFDGSAYFIEAGELKRLAEREPRLLAKFDTPGQLPAPLAKANYTLLPIKNGQYLLIPGDLFVAVTERPSPHLFQPTLPFPLTTAGRGSSEAQYIDQAFNSGLLNHFLGLEEMYLTIRSREYTQPFAFNFHGQRIEVVSVQIEVDAGYEAGTAVVLLEAKIGLPDHFNVRQLYYPFRHFSQLVNDKPIRSLFLAYDIPSATYYLYEYHFPDPLDPASITLKECAAYRLTEPQTFTVDALFDPRFGQGKRIVPQADDLNRIFELLTAVDSGFDTAEEVADWFLFARRQSNYYREAAEYLGFLKLRGQRYTLTEIGMQLLSAPPAEQPLLLAKAVINSWLFIELVKIARGNHSFFTNADIEALISTVKKKDGTPRYSGETVTRRRHTIVAWLRWLAAEIGCLQLEEDLYYLS